MFLPDIAIRQECLNRGLISPFRDEQLNPGSYDVTLLDDLTIYPNQFKRASTFEVVHIPRNMIGFVRGKSSRAREGLAVEFAGLIDPGFEGQITLECKNLLDGPDSRVLVYPQGTRIAQFYFGYMTGDCEHPYEARSGNYMNQRGVTPSVHE